MKGECLKGWEKGGTFDSVREGERGEGGCLKGRGKGE